MSAKSASSTRMPNCRRSPSRRGIARVLVLGYHSTKRLTELAIGVIKGAAQHLGQEIGITAETVMGPEGEYARLRIELLAASVTDQPVMACPVQTRT